MRSRCLRPPTDWRGVCPQAARLSAKEAVVSQLQPELQSAQRHVADQQALLEARAEDMASMRKDLHEALK